MWICSYIMERAIRGNLKRLFLAGRVSATQEKAKMAPHPAEKEKKTMKTKKTCLCVFSVIRVSNHSNLIFLCVLFLGQRGLKT